MSLRTVLFLNAEIASYNAILMLQSLVNKALMEFFPVPNIEISVKIPRIVSILAPALFSVATISSQKYPICHKEALNGSVIVKDAT